MMHRENHHPLRGRALMRRVFAISLIVVTLGTCLGLIYVGFVERYVAAGWRAPIRPLRRRLPRRLRPRPQHLRKQPRAVRYRGRVRRRCTRHPPISRSRPSVLPRPRRPLLRHQHRRCSIPLRRIQPPPRRPLGPLLRLSRPLPRLSRSRRRPPPPRRPPGTRRRPRPRPEHDHEHDTNRAAPHHHNDNRADDGSSDTATATATATDSAPPSVVAQARQHLLPELPRRPHVGVAIRRVSLG